MLSYTSLAEPSKGTFATQPFVDRHPRAHTDRLPRADAPRSARCHVR